MASATADPEMPAMMRLVTTATCESAPRKCPTNASDQWMSRCVTPPLFITANCPAMANRDVCQRTDRDPKEEDHYGTNG